MTAACVATHRSFGSERIDMAVNGLPNSTRRVKRSLKEYPAATTASTTTSSSTSSSGSSFVAIDLSEATTCVLCQKYIGKKPLVAICDCKECEGSRAHAACLSKFRGITDLKCPRRINCRCKQQPSQNDDAVSPSAAAITSVTTTTSPVSNTNASLLKRPQALSIRRSLPSLEPSSPVLAPLAAAELYATNSAQDLTSSGFLPSMARKQRLRAVRAQLLNADGALVSSQWQSQENKYTSSDLKEMNTKELNSLVEALQQALAAMSAELVTTLKNNNELADHIEVLKIHSELILAKTRNS